MLHRSNALAFIIYNIYIILRIPYSHSTWLWLNPRIGTYNECRLSLTV